MFLNFLSALGKLTKLDRDAFVEFVNRLGRNQPKAAEPDREEACPRQIHYTNNSR